MYMCFNDYESAKLHLLCAFVRYCEAQNIEQLNMAELTTRERKKCKHILKVNSYDFNKLPINYFLFIFSIKILE